VTAFVRRKKYCSERIQYKFFHQNFKITSVMSRLSFVGILCSYVQTFSRLHISFKIRLLRDLEALTHLRDSDLLKHLRDPALAARLGGLSQLQSLLILSLK